jgi:hypothetical protein
LKNLKSKLDSYWFGSVPAWPLAAFRAAFAFVLIAYFTDRMWDLGEFIGDSPARLPDLEMAGDSVLRHTQPLYLPPLSGGILAFAVVSFYLLAIALMVGCFSRTAAGLLAFWVAYVSLVDWLGSFSINRSSVLVLLMLATMPSGQVWAVDVHIRRWWKKRNLKESDSEDDHSSEEAFISAWPIRTLQWFLLIWYVLSGTAKLRGDWSLWSSNDVLWTQLQGWYQNPFCFWLLQNVPRAVVGLLQQVSLYFELLAPVWLLPRRIRPAGMLVGIGMHVAVAVLMSKLWYFSAEMIAFYILFLPNIRNRKTAPLTDSDT